MPFVWRILGLNSSSFFFIFWFLIWIELATSHPYPIGCHLSLFFFLFFLFFFIFIFWFLIWIELATSHPHPIGCNLSLGYFSHWHVSMQCSPLCTLRISRIGVSTLALVTSHWHLSMQWSPLCTFRISWIGVAFLFMVTPNIYMAKESSSSSSSSSLIFIFWFLIWIELATSHSHPTGCHLSLGYFSHRHVSMQCSPLCTFRISRIGVAFLFMEHLHLCDKRKLQVLSCHFWLIGSSLESSHTKISLCNKEDKNNNNKIAC